MFEFFCLLVKFFREGVLPLEHILDRLNGLVPDLLFLRDGLLFLALILLLLEYKSLVIIKVLLL